MSSYSRPRRLALGLACGLTLAIAGPAMASASRPFIDQFRTVRPIAATVPSSGPAAGDQNPYGTAVVPRTVGDLVGGDVLVSNFNDRANAQGTGSSILEVSPSGTVRLVAIVPRPTPTQAVGLTTALIALRGGYVVVGSLPAPGGHASDARGGALTVLDSHGRTVETFSGGAINGPWDPTALDGSQQVVLFVTNVLNGTVAAHGGNVDRGTVVRITLRIAHGKAPVVTSERVIATGLREHADPNALVVGPTGVGLDVNGTLYVADTARDRIAAIPDALHRAQPVAAGGQTVSESRGLMAPLGLAIAPNGDILSVNGGDGNIVETTPSGRQVAKKTLVPNGAGDLFGLAVPPRSQGIYFVDDAGNGAAANSLGILR